MKKKNCCESRVLVKCCLLSPPRAPLRFSQTPNIQIHSLTMMTLLRESGLSLSVCVCVCVCVWILDISQDDTQSKFAMIMIIRR